VQTKDLDVVDARNFAAKRTQIEAKMSQNCLLFGLEAQFEDRKSAAGRA
jgi:hypothetical protein